VLRWLVTPAAAILLGGCMTGAPSTGSEAAGDADRGRMLFTKCAACHTFDPAARPATGPHLAGIIGRRAGSLDDFAYTGLLRDQGFVWTPARLERWLKAPQQGFPGLCLPFTGFDRVQDRRDLIAWLARHPAKTPAPAN